MEPGSTTDQHLIDRQQKLTDGWNSMKVDKLMDNMVDEGLQYDDYAVFQFNMDKPTMTETFTHLFDVVEDLHFDTKSLLGNQDFTAWEYFVTMKQTKESPVMGPPKPELLKIRGTALIWWKDDKIKTCRDYSIWVDAEKEPK